MDKFWMVISEDGGNCITYKNYEEAKKGAERIARFKDSTFVVLEAMEVVEPQQMPVEWKAL